MSFTRRVFAPAPRFRLINTRSVAPSQQFWKYSSEATASNAAPAETPSPPQPGAEPAPSASGSTPTASESSQTTTTTTTNTAANPFTPLKAAVAPNGTSSASKPPPAAVANSRSRAVPPRVSTPRPAPRAPQPKPPANSSVGQQVPVEITWKPTFPPLSNRQSAPTPEGREPINWKDSFYGLGTQPVSSAQFAILTQPLQVNDIQIKPDGILYLPEINYRRRLNETFGPMGWGIVPRGESTVSKDIVTREYALIVNGRFVSQALGVNSYFNPEGVPQAIEGAKSNALMRCCKDLGIASELWDPNFIRWFNSNYIASRWIEHTITKKKRMHYFKKGTVPDVPYPYKVVS